MNQNNHKIWNRAFTCAFSFFTLHFPVYCKPVNCNYDYLGHEVMIGIFPVFTLSFCRQAYFQHNVHVSIKRRS